MFSEIRDALEMFYKCRNVVVEQRRMNEVDVLFPVTHFCSGFVLHTLDTFIWTKGRGCKQTSCLRTAATWAALS